MKSNLADLIFSNLLSLYNENKFVKLIDYGLSLHEKNKYPFIYNFVGASYVALDNFDQGISYYKKSITLDPNYFEVKINLAEVYRKQKNFKSAIAISQRAIKINKKSPKGYFVLGNIFYDVKDVENSLINYQKALNIEPDNYQANNNIGTLYFIRKNIKKALYYYNIALKKNNNSPEIYNNIGLLYKDTGDKNKAVQFFQKSLNLDFNFVDAHFNLGNVLKDKGDYLGSIEHYDKVLKVEPNHNKALSHKLFQLARICHWTEIDKYKKEIKTIGLKNGEIEPFAMLSFDDCSESAQRRAEIYVQSKYIKKASFTPKIKENKKLKIRLGYFSSDFRNHAIMALLSRMFELHDKDKFEIYAYSIASDVEDEVHYEVKKFFNHFRKVSNFSDVEVKNLVKEDKIDIAVDLNGYTQNNRVSLFLNKLAPIQINYLGYPGTMGSKNYDYIIADKIIVPENQKKYFNEKVLYMPNTYQPTNNNRNMSKNKLSRSDCSLPNDSFVFCCFNNNWKINKIEFEIWMKLLNKVPNSVLWLYKSNKYAEENIKCFSVSHGIEPERIIFADFLNYAEHLSRHSNADLFLDTFNYGAHTTASDALWTGLPVITKLGNSFPSRVCSSLLNAIELPELITHTNNEYEKLALDLALNPEKLKNIKHKLTHNIKTTKLFDTQQYTKDFENLMINIINKKLTKLN